MSGTAGTHSLDTVNHSNTAVTNDKQFVYLAHVTLGYRGSMQGAAS